MTIITVTERSIIIISQPPRPTGIHKAPIVQDCIGEFEITNFAITCAAAPVSVCSVGLGLNRVLGHTMVDFSRTSIRNFLRRLHCRLLGYSESTLAGPLWQLREAEPLTVPTSAPTAAQGLKWRCVV